MFLSRWGLTLRVGFSTIVAWIVFFLIYTDRDHYRAAAPFILAITAIGLSVLFLITLFRTVVGQHGKRR